MMEAWPTEGVMEISDQLLVILSRWSRNGLLTV